MIRPVWRKAEVLCATSDGRRLQ